MVRVLLIVKISEEANREAKRISLIALGIAVLALIAGLVQALAALGVLPTVSPIQASPPLVSDSEQAPARK